MVTIIGVGIVVFALVSLVGLTLWSRAKIESLAEQGFPSAREAAQGEENE